MGKKNTITGFGCGLIFVFFCVFLFLIQNVWHIFGFWSLALSLYLILLQTAVMRFSIRRMEKESTVTYNPKEFPLYIGCLLGSFFIAYLYYLYTQQTPTSLESGFGMAYLLCNALANLSQFVQVFQNKDDKIELSPDGISWIDLEGTKNHGQKISWSKIRESKAIVGQITLTLYDESIVQIETKQMNMLSMEKHIHTDIEKYLQAHGHPSQP